jgi:hypothetical protein
VTILRKFGECSLGLGVEEVNVLPNSWSSAGQDERVDGEAEREDAESSGYLVHR